MGGVSRKDFMHRACSAHSNGDYPPLDLSTKTKKTVWTISLDFWRDHLSESNVKQNQFSQGNGKKSAAVESRLQYKTHLKKSVMLDQKCRIAILVCDAVKYR